MYEFHMKWLFQVAKWKYSGKDIWTISWKFSVWYFFLVLNIFNHIPEKRNMVIDESQQAKLLYWILSDGKWKCYLINHQILLHPRIHLWMFLFEWFGLVCGCGSIWSSWSFHHHSRKANRKLDNFARGKRWNKWKKWTKLTDNDHNIFANKQCVICGFCNGNFIKLIFIEHMYYWFLNFKQIMLTHWLDR